VKPNLNVLLPVLVLCFVLSLSACGGGDGALPSTYDVSGKVDDDQDGIEGVSIVYEGDESGVESTDSDGRYELVGLSGRTTITAEKDGWVFSDSETVTNDDTVDFTGMRKEYPLTVHVDGHGEVVESILVTDQSTDYEYGTTVRDNR